jgi:nitroreductase
LSSAVNAPLAVVFRLETPATLTRVEAPVKPVPWAIATRRSLRQFRADPIPREVIQRLLVAAVQAPNHRRTQPWRFFVVDEHGPVRDGLRDLAREVALGRANQIDDGALARAESKVREMTDTPVLLIVYAMPGRDSMETQENYAAVCCGVQNILLAATEEGVAVGWSTGGVCSQPERVAELVGADASWQLAALLYVGMPDETKQPAVVRRAAPDSFTAWLN